MGSRTLYSVFVGHLPPETTKRELNELFSNCGNVADLFINENEKGGPFKYGFVRFKELDSAVQAIKELNRWKVRGEPIVVDLSKDTRERIEREKLQMADRLMTKETKKSTETLQVPRVKSSEVINDVMYLSRLKENCASLNFEISKQKAGLTEKGDKALREIEIDKVLDYIANTEKGRPKTIIGQVSEQPSLDSVRDKLLQSDDVNEVEAKARADTFMSVLSNVMETISMFVSDTNTGMKKQQEDHGQASEQSQGKKSAHNNGISCLSKSSSGMFSQSSDSCDEYSGQKIFYVGAHKKHAICHHTGASVKSVNDPNSDSSSVSSDDDLDHRNRDSGVELDSSTKKFTSKSTKNNKELSFSRQSSDEMPSLELGESTLPHLSRSSSGKLESKVCLDSNLSKKESGLLSRSVSQQSEGEHNIKLKRQAKSDGDLLVSKQKTEDSLKNNGNGNFMDWVINKLKESEINKGEDEDKEDEAAGGTPSSRDKMVASSQFQTYYLKAILGRGRGFNPPTSQTDDYWIKGGRWGRGHT